MIPSYLLSHRYTYWQFVLYLIAAFVTPYFWKYLIMAWRYFIVCVTLFIADGFLRLLFCQQLNCNAEVFNSLFFFVFVTHLSIVILQISFNFQLENIEKSQRQMYNIICRYDCRFLFWALVSFV